MSRTNTSLSRQINSTTKILIFPVGQGITTSTSIYAVNWFNLKHKWLYNFYNILASPLVLKVGGKVHFKGFQTRKIHGKEEDGRDALLIVNYDGPLPFLDMISKTYFQLISILRITATKQFNFAFTKRQDNEAKTDSNFRGKHYLVHHYRKSADTSFNVSELMSIVSELNIKVHYSGEKIASVVREDQKGVRQEAPFIMNGIVVLESNANENFDKLMQKESFKGFLTTFDSNYIGVFDRVA